MSLVSFFQRTGVQVLLLVACCIAMIAAGALTVNLYAKCDTFSGTEPVHADVVGWIEVFGFGVAGLLALIGCTVLAGGVRVLLNVLDAHGFILTGALMMSAIVLFVGGAYGISVYTACGTWTTGDDVTIIRTELGFIIAAMLAGLAAIAYAAWRVYRSLSTKSLGDRWTSMRQAATTWMGQYDDYGSNLVA